LGLDCI